ncbi:mitogen-activated protein kinase 7-like [Mercenaria mercenaria]|uniref:mitogen-activated protein kinase 7-like n=1 Tax=Mercenaria mercenaria TaxID=6596 RepID=UPI00234F0781|nr:mitogen-activated protein kinase 7-like [Mercenaria mercenaria]
MEDAARREKEEKEERQRQREERRIQRQKEEEERLVKRQKREMERRSKALSKEMVRMKRAVGGRLAAKKFTCGVCGGRGRMNDEINGVMWYDCDESLCERWYHEDCLSVREREYLLESVSERCDWFCRKCKPWLYVEE